MLHALIKTCRIVVLVASLAALLVTAPPRRGHATESTTCQTCLPVYMAAHKLWLKTQFFADNLLAAMQMMTEQMNAVAMHQMLIVGKFLDAKHQLETQRLFQRLKVEAHRDYQPSEDYCWFGTNTRSLAPSEHISDFNTRALHSRQMARHLGTFNLSGSLGRDQDKAVRWRRFRERYCDPEDNHWEPREPQHTGLADICENDGADGTKLVNLDLDYTRLIDTARSLNIAFHREKPSDPPFEAGEPEPNELDVITLGNNLYGHNVLSRRINKDYLKSPQAQDLYLDLRTVAAKRSVAENSYNHIVGMKAYGSSDDPDKDYRPVEPPLETPKTHKFLAAIMVELGVSEDEVFHLIGLRPSYYAQMELLSKKIYQNPNFYARLQEKPANVARKGAAIQALNLMLGRDIYESQLRREMILSVLLSTRLRRHYESINRELPSIGE